MFAVHGSVMRDGVLEGWLLTWQHHHVFSLWPWAFEMFRLPLFLDSI